MEGETRVRYLFDKSGGRGGAGKEVNITRSQTTGEVGLTAEGD